MADVREVAKERSDGSDGDILRPGIRLRSTPGCAPSSPVSSSSMLFVICDTNEQAQFFAPLFTPPVGSRLDVQGAPPRRFSEENSG
jgi:hypothetical protein